MGTLADYLLSQIIPYLKEVNQSVTNHIVIKNSKTWLTLNLNQHRN